MIPLDATGFIEGDFFAPAAAGLSRVRVVTTDGDGATSAVLGHLTALVYRRGDPTARCPDVPEGALTGCALEAGFSGESFVGTSAPLTTIPEWFADRAWLPNNSPSAYGAVRRVYLYDNTQNPARHYLDTTDTFNGNPTLAGVYDASYVGTLGAGTAGFFDPAAIGAGDLTMKLVFKAEPDFDITGLTPDTNWLGDTGLALLEKWVSGTVGNAFIFAVLAIGEGRLQFRYVLAFGSTVVVDLGPSTVAATGAWMQLLWRTEIISSTQARMSLYLDPACPGTPTLLHQVTITASEATLLGARDVYTMDWNFSADNVAVSPSTVRTAQLGATYTAADYGL